MTKDEIRIAIINSLKSSLSRNHSSLLRFDDSSILIDFGLDSYDILLLILDVESDLAEKLPKKGLSKTLNDFAMGSIRNLINALFKLQEENAK